MNDNTPSEAAQEASLDTLGGDGIACPTLRSRRGRRPPGEAPQGRPGLREWPVAERPRERLRASGVSALSDAELLALILGGGSAGVGSVVDLSRHVLLRFGGIQGLSSAGLGELLDAPGIGPARAGALVALGELGRRLSATWARPRPGPLQQSGEVYRLVLPRLLGRRQEIFLAVALDGRNQVRSVVTVARGTAVSVEVHPREVFGPLLREGAAAAIVVHNHPSGDPEPSSEDISLTERLVEVGRLAGIPILDHLIIGDAGYVSFADRGLLPMDPGGDF